LYCAFWPSAPTQVVERGPLVAQNVPTFVLNATLDPATPFQQGKTVFENLENGYHLYVEGGRHSIYGFGQECPDATIDSFMLNGELPSQREIVCQWDPAVIQAYVPLMPGDVSEFSDPLEIFYAIDNELTNQPEYYYSYFDKDTAFACPFGGSFTFGPSDAGESYNFSNCEFTKGFAITGTGGFDYNASILTLEAQVSGAKSGTLTYISNYGEGSISVTGDYGGESIDLSQ